MRLSWKYGQRIHGDIVVLWQHYDTGRSRYMVFNRATKCYILALWISDYDN